MENFASRKPFSPLLQKHIAYYYFHDSDLNTSTQTYVYYPHFKNALTIYKGSKITFENDLSTITEPSVDKYCFSYAKLVSQAAKSKIIPPYRKIGVVFQPMGLNYFIDDDLCHYVKNPINLNFNLFRNSITPFLDRIFKTEIIKERIILLDEYFESQFKNFKEDRMINAIDTLHCNDEKYTVQALSDEIGVSRKTLLRLFKKHQNCSVIDYIKLIQFRNSIDQFLNSEDQLSLTRLAMNSSYYDQSDFINHFNKLTGFNPSSFFNGLSDIGDQGTFWTLD